jgi:indolepyruvate ferredoxin oxidoreductase
VSAADAGDGADLPAPTLPDLAKPWDILITGIGGTGVVTISAILGMAGHLERKGVVTLDMTGLAQKYGAVSGFVRIATKPADIHAIRVADGNAKLLLGCDIVTSASKEALAKATRGVTRAVINGHETPTADFTRNPDADLHTRELRDMIAGAVGPERADFVDATGIATALLGDAIAANMFLLGFAWQKGLVPLGQDSILRAIELNGVAIDFNKQAFLWGRRAAHDPAAVQTAARPAETALPLARTLDEVIERRVEFLTGYQSRRYAERYRKSIERVRAAEQDKAPGMTGLADAAARYLFKLMAYKDEYEVARLYTATGFLETIADRFEGDYTLNFHLAPPGLAERDKNTGELRKKAYGPWMLKAFRALAKFRSLRGTALDPFGRSAERRMERQLIADYEKTLDELLAGLNHDNHGLAVEIATIPEHIRGYGHVKQRHLADAKRREAELLEAFRQPAPLPQAAE